MPGEKWEDPQCVAAIRKARENIGDLKLKSDGDYVVPKHLRMNAQQKRAQLIGLETKVRANTKQLLSPFILLLHNCIMEASNQSDLFLSDKQKM